MADDEISLLRVFDWPRVIENLLDTATSKVLSKKALVESQLRAKKAEFELEYGKNYLISFIFEHLNFLALNDI